MPKITDEVLQQHVGATLLRSDDPEAEVLVRKPSRPEYQRFRTLLINEESRGVAYDSLAACYVYPSPDNLAVLFGEYPGLEIAFGNDILRLAGHGAAIQKKTVTAGSSPK